MNQFNHNKIFTISSDVEFEDIAIEVFQFQYKHCSIYRQYVDSIRIEASGVDSLAKIPFLPIEFFKTHRVIHCEYEAEVQFSSSGTTSSQASSHHVAKLDLYRLSFEKGFELFYGSPSQYVILALLPAYLERKGSSLVYMVDKLVDLSNNQSSGFYLYNHNELIETLIANEEGGLKTLLLGVSFALLDLAQKNSLSLKNTIVMETGGMKGRGKELIRQELHEELKRGFGVESIHSEYGMTELLSQAYSNGDGLFRCPPWMKILIRDVYDPFVLVQENTSGGINVIDLANVYSCSFIETQDIGKIIPDNCFEILGRIDKSDIRGCNLMV